jgi:hypothetical protein
VGPIYRRWYAVMGDTVNLAARLVAKAPVGRVYATRDVLRRAKTGFEQTALEPFAVKGKSRPVHAWDVGRPVRGASDAAIRLELPLVGRSRELSQLRDAVDRARRGSGALIEVAGETGVGKSRLIAEAGKFAQDMVRLRATCEVYTRDSPYSAWGGPLRALLGVSEDDPDSAVLERIRAEIDAWAPDLAPWLPLIAIAFDVSVEASPEVEQLAEASREAKLHEVVLRFLRRAMAVPTLVEVEQAHLMDAASVALFEALSGELASSAWVVLVSRRDVSGGMVLGGEHVRIELGPLTLSETRALALATPEAAQLPPHVVDLAVGRSGGSPEFLLDLLAAAAEGDRDQLPESIDAATMARIDALDPEDGELVRRAAVRRYPMTVCGIGCPACSSASGMDKCASGARPSRRWRTRASRSSCGGSCTRRSGSGWSASRARMTPTPPSCRTTSRWRATTSGPSVTPSSRRAGRPSVSLTPTRSVCTGGPSTRAEHPASLMIRACWRRPGSSWGRSSDTSASRWRRAEP